MPQSLAKVSVHIVFATKQRKPWLDKPDLRSQLYAYMATILKTKVDSPALIIGGTADHVHVLLLLSRKVPIMKVVEEMKTESAKWIKRYFSSSSDFAWQHGYGIFSVSESNIAEVRTYIENQEQHHQKLSFQDEFRALCQRHGLQLDERYAWD